MGDDERLIDGNVVLVDILDIAFMRLFPLYAIIIIYIYTHRAYVVAPICLCCCTDMHIPYTPSLH